VDRIGEQQDLLLALIEAAAMEAAEARSEAVEQDRIFGHRSHDIGQKPETFAAFPAASVWIVPAPIRRCGR